MSESRWGRTGIMKTSNKLSYLAMWSAALVAADVHAQAPAQRAPSATPAAPRAPSAASAAPTAPPKFTAQQLTAPPTTGWITNGGNVYNQRYSPLARINKSNVATLKPAWRTHLNGSGTESK